MAVLPHGRGLPEALWEVRHRWMVRILWLNVPLLMVVALGFGYELRHAVEHVLPVIGLTLAAARSGGRTLRSMLAATALLTCGALLVHSTNGLIESHFHFFASMTLLAFYEDWKVYGLSVAYVLLHHGVAGTLLADTYPVFQHAAHPDTSPWVWAVVHAVAILLAGVANVLLWRMNERSRDAAGAEAQRRAHAEAVAATLAASLAPAPMPDMGERGAVCGRHLPGDGDIGGDFYEVIDLGDGRIGVGLGDVAGHGIQAAGLTAKLRYTMRAYALDRRDPCAVMDKLERALGIDGSATCAYVVVDPAAETVTCSLAGHLPPLVKRPDGTVEPLTGALSPLLAGLGVPHTQQTWPFPAGSTLVAYSDGLVERRGENIDEGLRRLREAVAQCDGSPQELCERLPQRMLAGRRQVDDIAVVALRTEAVPRPAMPAAERLTGGQPHFPRSAIRRADAGRP